MKIIQKFFIGAVIITMAASCSQYKCETVPGDPLGAKIYTLDNGLKVYMIVNRDVPRIDAQIAVRVGSKNDPRETTGLAHYFEHLMFKGTDKFGTQNYELEKPMLDRIEALFEEYRQTEGERERAAIYHVIDSISYEASKLAIPNEYDKLMSSLGSTGTNAYTNYDVTCYVENIPSNQVEAWAKVQAERFQNVVLRGFHTELETIYEEYNMHAVSDQSKSLSALNDGLFEHHPYKVDIIGLPEHLKNPSMTNVKKYHDTWYVPNNMAVILVGDLNPSKTIRIIDKYFSVLKPNKNLECGAFEPEKPIEKPIVKDVYGKEAPNVMLGWRFPGATYEDLAVLDVFSNMIYNGTAGLIDIDVNQQQKTLYSYASLMKRTDYNVFFLYGSAKAKQSLDEVSGLLLDEVEKIKRGEFDDDLLTSSITEMKLRRAFRLDMSTAVAHAAVESFINGTPWEDFVREPERISAVTREDVIRFANENFKDNYVRVNKHQGKDLSEKKINKPAITPIFTNRDTSSAYLRNLQTEIASVKPIEPVFLDFSKDMSVLKAKSGIEVLYKQNTTSDLYELTITMETGSFADKILPFACKYLDYLGTSTMSSEQIVGEFYRNGAKFMVGCDEENTSVLMVGLGEYMKGAVKTMESLFSDAQANPEALERLKASEFNERINAKTNQTRCASRLLSYGRYGARNPDNTVLSNKEIAAITDRELLDVIHGLFSKEHRIIYYGPMSPDELLAAIDELHLCPEQLTPVVKGNPYKYVVPEENEVFVVPFDANQVVLYSISNAGENYDPAMVPAVRMYNEYFGGSMNAIVFQEMREARGLAYSASARYVLPSDLDHNCLFQAAIKTQNDKVIDAMTAFDEIINEMPVSENAFAVAKEALISTYRTSRTTKSDVLEAYLRAERLGLDYDINRDVYAKVRNYTLDDVVRFQQEVVKDRKFRTVILGRKSDIDMKALEQFGKVTVVPLDELFGY